MKHLPIAGKVIALLFSAALLVACSNSDTKEQDEAAAAAAAAAAARAAQGSSSSGDLSSLEQAAAAPGNVFYFEFDSSTLTPEAVNAVDAHIAVLKVNNENVRLEGHTDERGTREYNIALGERRANAVRQVMSAMGVPPQQIRVVSYGEERPAAVGQDEQSHALNRRVEIVY